LFGSGKALVRNKVLATTSTNNSLAVEPETENDTAAN
jgi:hypothetical protein